MGVEGVVLDWVGGLCEGGSMFSWGCGSWRVGELGGAGVCWTNVGRWYGEVPDKASDKVVCG